MAKGDKKKKEKSDSATPDAVLTTLTENRSMSCAAAEPDGEEAAAEPDGEEAAAELSEPVCVSEPPQDTNLPELELLNGPVLPNIIVQRYEGEKCGELFHGEGAAVFQGGHEYKGGFVEGLMHGHGKYTWSDGMKYEGEFVLNAPMGHGIYTWLDGSTYEGEVCYGMRHGVGTFKCAKTSSVYKGQWYRGKRHGKGTINYDEEGTSWYEGDWENNRREGWGVRCYRSGNIYSGQWKNNVLHGEGMMRWIQLGQQYSGQWVNGVQHGQGTHTWFLRRVSGSQYPLRNEYKGDFVQSLRHGQGTFSYASGAVYSGEWKHNKKHGQGKFIFTNGRIFEGEFINDRMAEFPAFSIEGTKTPDLDGIRTHSPPPVGSDRPRKAKKSGVTASPLGPDVALNIETLLNRIPEAQRDQELRQVEFAILRHIALFRMIYSFYSRLGQDHSPDNTFLLTRLQFWRFLKDCGVHHHGITLAQMDRLIDEDVSTEEVHSPFSTVLLRKCLSYVVIAAYHIYHKDIGTSKNVLVDCFSKLMRQNIIPNAKNVKGPLFCHPLRAMIGLNYIERCWEIYQVFCKAKNTALCNQTMTARHFIWMFKDLGLLDGELTTARVLEILSLENPAIYNPSHSNLDLEISFLEFFEALLGCAEVKTKDGNSEHFQSELACQHEIMRTSRGDARDSFLLSKQTSPQFESNSHLIISPGDGSATSIEVGPVLSDSQNGSFRSYPQLKVPQNTLNCISLTVETNENQRINSTSKMTAINKAGIEMQSEDASCALAKDSKQPSINAEEMRPEEEHWIQKTDQFFTQIFFPAYEHNLMLKEEVQEERLRQITKNRIALEKAKENFGLREQYEAEQEERLRAEEHVQDDDLYHSLPALVTPVALSTTESLKPSPPSGGKKKKK